MKKNIFNLLLAGLIAVSLTACDGDDNSKAPKQSVEGKVGVVTVTKASSTTHLYYEGVIDPASVHTILSKVNGTVMKTYFTYGSSVKNCQLLLLLSSEDLEQKFKTDLTSFLEKKQSYQQSIENFQGTKELSKAGLITGQTYRSDQDQHETSALDYYQAYLNLKHVLNLIGLNEASIEKLSIGNTKQVNTLLQRKFDNIQVISDAEGIVLYPIDTGSGAGSEDGGNSNITTGSSVKLGQALVDIGDLSAYKIKIKIDQVNISKIKAGEEAAITGDGFPGMVLKGVVTSVASQAKSSGGFSGQATFPAEITVKNVTVEQRKRALVGMTVKVDLEVANPPQMTIPLSAVFQKDGQSLVTLVVNAAAKQYKNIPVSTGETTQTGIAIISGLTAGQQIMNPGVPAGAAAKK